MDLSTNHFFSVCSGRSNSLLKLFVTEDPLSDGSYHGIVALTAHVNNALNLVTSEEVPKIGGCLNIVWILLVDCLSANLNS
jgi:hypothetical protein